MPGSLYAWYSLYDLDVLADREAVLSGEIELRQLTRLREILHSDRGSIQTSLKFHRHAHSAVTVELTFTTAVELICQRCLEPLVQEVSEQVSLTLLEPGSMDGEIAKQNEAVVLKDGKLNPAALLEDELILSLPIIPRHTKIDECGSMAHVVQALAPEEHSGIAGPPLRNN
ncbi:MAG: YceD family protein [Gammaproteobacteria bacterium]|nr:YceD family protein [Gammaproteobacteria bacterium]MCZ6498601.1 YceD family protein [Gammaproteobacteria bacterium]MCZ6586079.1 YceD family protein [Gammaproteobacteria bacterium]